MDLVTGVKAVYVMTSHCTSGGEPKLVAECRYPLTGMAVVSRVYTDLAVIDIGSEGFAVRELAPGITLNDVAQRTAAPVVDARSQLTQRATPDLWRGPSGLAQSEAEA